jgi:hypothetical protein
MVMVSGAPKGQYEYVELLPIFDLMFYYEKLIILRGTQFVSDRGKLTESF